MAQAPYYESKRKHVLRSTVMLPPWPHFPIPGALACPLLSLETYTFVMDPPDR